MSRRQRRQQQRRRRSAKRPRAGHARLATGAGISLAAALGAPAAAQATDFTVTDAADPAAPGPCLAGDCSLREAVEAAAGNTTDDRILFQAGLSGPITLTEGPLSVDEPLDVLGPGAAALTISGGGVGRIFSIETAVNDDVTISGLTLTGGATTTGKGAAIDSKYAALVIRDATISGNQTGSASGGGVYSDQGTLTIEDSTISGNSAAILGGGVFSNQGTTTIMDSTISGNHATGSGTGYGGGVAATGGGTMTITDSTISGNDADHRGGGVYSETNTTTIENSTISGNDAVFRGGGAYLRGGTAIIENSTIQGNDTSSQSGGVEVRSAATTIESSTISGNTAAVNGGGLYSYACTPDPTLINTIVAANSAPTSPDHLGGGGDQLDASFSLIGNTAGATINETVAGSNITDQSAQLATLAENGGPTKTMAPALASPAIDAGSGSGSDQRGLARPVNLPAIPNSTATGADGADIGAVEFQLPSNAFTIGALTRKPGKGTATLAVSVPGAGTLKLAGAKLKGATKNPTAAGVVKLLIRAKGRAKRRLRRTGRAKVLAAVTFTPTAPTAGNSRTQSRKVRLVKRKRR